MPVFEYVLILLTAICLSNIVNRFIPVISVPIVQIALGALVTLLPLGFRFELDPSLFFVLFVAPLIFHISVTADKTRMWAQRKPILNLGIVLVFVSVIVVGLVMHALIPAIPLAAIFALVAALGPTDDVAVSSVGKRVNVPPKIMGILEGESIINDASGIVCFQFALAAALTGTFSPAHAAGRFLIVGLGGIAVGLLLSGLKYGFVRWIRSLGMEHVTFHLLLAILTPFVIYLIAERLEVSGILAIFAAGIAHSFNKDKFNPETVNFNIASKSVWSMLTFTLEGLVFVILGTQLPQILSSIKRNAYSISTTEIIFYTILIVALFLFLRFIWAIATIKTKTYEDPEHPVSRFRAGIIFSLSGARGTVTLASVMSIPLLWSDGSAFPERDLIILIASGVIVISLLITSFVLPLCVEKKVKNDTFAENNAHLEILRNVIQDLRHHVTPENRAAMAFVTANYHSRSIELQRKQNIRFADRENERKLKLTMYEWEKANVLEMLEHGETDEYAAQRYLDILDALTDKLSKKNFNGMHVLRKKLIRFLHRNRFFKSKQELLKLRTRIVVLIEANARCSYEKLRQMCQQEDSSAVRKMMADCESRLLFHQRSRHHGKIDKEILASVASQGFQLERDNIRTMFETGRISRETAKDLRHNIALLELQLKRDYF